MQFPYPPPAPGDLPTAGPAFLFFICVLLVFGVVEFLLTLLPKGLQKRVNQIRFGPRWKG
jgi:hypothetical protein